MKNTLTKNLYVTGILVKSLVILALIGANLSHAKTEENLGIVPGRYPPDLRVINSPSELRKSFWKELKVLGEEAVLYLNQSEDPKIFPRQQTYEVPQTHIGALVRAHSLVNPFVQPNSDPVLLKNLEDLLRVTYLQLEIMKKNQGFVGSEVSNLSEELKRLEAALKIGKNQQSCKDAVSPVILE